MSFYESLAGRLVAIKFPLAGAHATPQLVEQMFSLDYRDPGAAALMPQALDSRFCEEHLAVALATVRQAIEERQEFFALGERFAYWTLSISADQSSVDLLKEEVAVFKLREDVSKAVQTGETYTKVAIQAHVDSLAKFATTIKPGGDLASGEAQRQFWLAYISRALASGYGTMQPYWGSENRVDLPVAEGEAPYTMPYDKAIVDSEAELARRSSQAAFRVAYSRTLVDQAAADAADTAAVARVAAAAAAAAFDAGSVSLADKRYDASQALITAKVAMTTEISLLDLRRQMALSRNRAQELHLEAKERAENALAGLREVYGLELSDTPASTLETADELLSWCRAAGRALLGYDRYSAQQRFTVSVREIAGLGWKNDLKKGVIFDATVLADLGAVVRLRDVGARSLGTHAGSISVKVRPPVTAVLGDIRDRDAAGNPRSIHQMPPQLTLIACGPESATEQARSTSGRLVHNLCAAGKWLVSATTVPQGVEDVLIDLDVAYLAL